MLKKFLPLFFIFATVLLLYHPVFGVYFSQDDFFHFKVSQTDGSLRGFINLFGFYPFEERGIAFYRPIFREVLYNSFYSLFGLTVLPFRVLSFGIHFINIVLVYFLMQRLFRKPHVAFFVAFFFGLSAANVATLYYLAGGIQAQGTTIFMLLTIILFLTYLKGKVFIWKLFSFLAFVLALMSHELSITTPFILGGILWTKEKVLRKTLWRIRELWPFFATVFVFLCIEVVKIGFSKEEVQYQAVFSIKRAINSFTWYCAWALGIPEMLIDFVQSGPKLNPSLMRYWGEYFKIIFPAFLVSSAIITGSAVYLFITKRSFFKRREFWLLVLWFPVILLPVIFLPLHKSTYYLTPALPAFWGAVGLLVFNAVWRLERRYIKLARVMLWSLVASLLILSITSARLGDSTYWAASRGRLAEKLLADVKREYPQLPEGAVVYFKNDPSYPFVAKEWGSTSKQASFILNGDDALQLFYGDPTLQVFYEDLGGVPAGLGPDNVYQLVARIQTEN